MQGSVKKEKTKATAIEWECQLTALDKPLDQLSVGEKAGLICQGEFLKEPEGPVKILFKDEKQEFKIYILETKELQPQRVDMIVTSYKPGKHSLNAMQLSFSNGETVKLKPLDMLVNTVIEQKKGQQPPKPIGPKGPYEVPLPWWYYSAYGFAFLAFFFVIASVIRKLLLRKKTLEEMQQYQTALSAYNQFNKDLRVLMRPFSNLKDENITPEKVTEFITTLKQLVTMYLVRELKVPAHNLSGKQVMSELKKRHKKIYRNSGVVTYKLLLEFDRFNKGNEFKRYDCDQLALMARDTVSLINKFANPGANK